MAGEETECAVALHLDRRLLEAGGEGYALRSRVALELLWLRWSKLCLAVLQAVGAILLEGRLLLDLAKVVCLLLQGALLRLCKRVWLRRKGRAALCKARQVCGVRWRWRVRAI